MKTRYLAVLLAVAVSGCEQQVLWKLGVGRTAEVHGDISIGNDKDWNFVEGVERILPCEAGTPPAPPLAILDVDGLPINIGDVPRCLGSLLIGGGIKEVLGANLPELARVNADALRSLKEIRGWFIVTNTNLESLDDLKSLDTPIDVHGGIAIFNNKLFTLMEGFEKIHYVSGDIIIAMGEGESDLRGLEQLTEVHGNFHLAGRPLSFAELSNLRCVEGSMSLILTGEPNNCGEVEELCRRLRIGSVGNLRTPCPCEPSTVENPCGTTSGSSSSATTTSGSSSRSSSSRASSSSLWFSSSSRPSSSGAPSSSLWSSSSSRPPSSGTLSSSLWFSSTSQSPTSASSSGMSPSSAASYGASSGASSVGGSSSAAACGSSACGPEGCYGWRRTITLNNNGLALVDFQIPIDLNLAELESTAKMQTGGNDLRIATGTGTVLPHWIEPGASSPGRVWVRVANVPSGASGLELYYGNPGAPDVSDGSVVFELFDDFDSDSLDAQWTKYTENTGTITVTGGSLVLASPSGTGSDGVAAIIGPRFDGDFILGGRGRPGSSVGPSTSSDGSGSSLLWRTSTTGQYWLTGPWASWGFGGSTAIGASLSGVDGGPGTGVPNLTNSGPATGYISRFSDSFEFFTNRQTMGTLATSAAGWNNNSAVYPCISANSYGNSHPAFEYIWDYVFVAKATGTPPEVVVGAEVACGQ